MRYQFLVLLGLLLHHVSFAETPVAGGAEKARPRHFAAGNLGYGLGVSGGGGNFFTYGARVGFGVLEDTTGILSLGLSVGRTSSSQSVSGVTVSGSTTVIMAEMICRNAWKSPLYFGVRIGPGLTSGNVTTSTLNVSATATSLAYGPVVGGEIKVNDSLSVNLDANWLSVGGGTLNFPTLGSVTYTSTSNLLLQIGLMYTW